MYKILRSILFLFPTEWVHYFSMNCLKLLCSIGIKRKFLTSYFSPRSMVNGEWSMGELKFKNPVGLGAGFDKNAKYLRELEVLGFGFIEIGTVTPLPQSGNEKPRLFRLPKDKALINRMGFNNDGVKLVVERLKKWKESQEFRVGRQESRDGDSELRTKDSRLIIGGNIGKNKLTPNDEAWKDYDICFRELFDWVDYFVVNVSSPNTPGLRELQEKESLRKILSHLQTINAAQTLPKPLLLKIAPDLTKEQLDDVIDLALEIKLDGLVCTNTTISRSGLMTHNSRLTTIGAGGLSGLPLKQRSTEIIKYISEKTKKQIPIIASGGIFTGTDAKEKLDAGASLVQVWTGFIYEGPGIVKKICKDLNTQ
ncbi:MAG: quinone-dependent dihydroorotate dehydrogenase [Bacteroidota bacterium]